VSEWDGKGSFGSPHAEAGMAALEPQPLAFLACVKKSDIDLLYPLYLVLYSLLQLQRQFLTDKKLHFKN
jgi:hypothetical protein